MDVCMFLHNKWIATIAAIYLAKHPAKGIGEI